MELEQLFFDTKLLCGGELSLAEFLLYYDMCMRRYLTLYPKKLLLPHGEYVRPERLEGSCDLPDSFYFAILYYISGIFLENAAMFADADKHAEKAYLALWKEAARGKRLAGDRW